MPKSGTTAIQRAATARRAELLEHGVNYPGTGHNHSQASTAVAGQRRARPGVAAGSDKHWARLLDEIRGEERRVFLSHEFFAEHPVEVCRRIVTELDREVHVVLTMRNQASLLGSAWQQTLKQGSSASFEEWLRTVLGERAPGQVLPFDLRTDLAGIVSKWASLVGPSRVTVIVLDRAEPERLTESFEDLLDLPRGLLGVDLGGDLANRSLTASEAETLRQMNVSLHSSGHMARKDFRALYRGGGIDRLLAREPGREEASIQAPQWAVDAMVERAKDQVTRLAELGVRVVGDLDVLARPVPSATNGAGVSTTPIPAARAMALGILERALELAARDEERRALELTTVRSAPRRTTRRRPRGSSREQLRTSTRATEDIPLRVLAMATAGRVAARLRRLVRRPDRKKGS